MFCGLLYGTFCELEGGLSDGCLQVVDTERQFGFVDVIISVMMRDGWLSHDAPTRDLLGLFRARF